MIKSVHFFTLMLVFCVGSSVASLVYSTAPSGRGQGGTAYQDWGLLVFPTSGLNNNVYDIPNFIDESPYKEIIVQWIWASQNSGNVPYVWETLTGADAQLLGDETVRMDGCVMVDSCWIQWQ
jgi:hypothetical protein